MRTSTYEIILPLIGRDEKEIQGKKLLVNGLYGAMDVVEDETAAAVEKGGSDDLPADVRERLASRGHITRRSVEEELRDVELLGRIHARTEARITVAPVILPTYNCNFRCPYCFERHRLSRGEEWLEASMKPEMVDAVFSALKRQREKGRIIEGCSLYGGEPFLKENKETVRNICEHAKEMGLKLSAITNGYDLEHYIDLLKEYEFRNLQITVDGVGSTNDRRRLHRDGRGRAPLRGFRRDRRFRGERGGEDRCGGALDLGALRSERRAAGARGDARFRVHRGRGARGVGSGCRRL